ncbi:MAG: D-alanyl-D-alanine carboxypeptidase [bacterium]
MGGRRLRGMLLSIVIAALGMAAPAAAAPTATPTKQALDKLVADGVPGAIALERRNGTATRSAAGVRNLATGDPIRATDRFRIGSMTKAFVSTVVLQLAAERRLSLHDSVEHWLPGVVPNGAGITIRELLNHTSGLYDYIDLPFYVQLLHDPLRTWRPPQLVELAVAHPPLFAPGTSWSYSNTNYILLGMIVARTQRLPRALEMAGPALAVYGRVIAPLGLWHTSFPLTNPDIAGPHPHGYLIGAPPEWGFPPVLDTTRIDPSWAWTAGAIVSTLDDVADFHRALFGGRLLPAQQQRELQTTVPAGPGLDYGLGVFRLDTPCGVAWGHDGGTPSAVSISLTSADGTRQAALAVTSDANAWTEQIAVDYSSALLTAFCGQAPSSTASAVSAMAATLPSLDRLRR